MVPVIEVVKPSYNSANAQRSSIIQGKQIKEVLKARYDIHPDGNYFIYVQHHKTGYKQAAIIFLDEEIYGLLYQFVTCILPSLPIGQPRDLKDNSVFQTTQLVSNTISHCFRAGLLLFGLDDPEACPTQYRKAASTLMSMHNPAMQEALSQFMCHERSTAERHYRHHMSHRYLSTVFTGLAKCQTLTSPTTSLAVYPKYATSLPLPDPESSMKNHLRMTMTQTVTTQIMVYFY